MKRFVMTMAAVAVLTASGPVWAQTDPATPEKLALAREVFQTANLPQMLDGITAMTAGVTQGMLSKLPNAQQQKLAAFQRASNEEMKAYFIPKMIDQMTDAYARTFTVNELQGILAFYQSPTGQALLGKTPTLMQAFTPQIMTDIPEFLRGTINRYCTENTCTTEEHATFDKTLAGFPAAK